MINNYFYYQKYSEIYHERKINRIYEKCQWCIFFASDIATCTCTVTDSGSHNVSYTVSNITPGTDTCTSTKTETGSGSRNLNRIDSVVGNSTVPKLVPTLTSLPGELLAQIFVTDPGTGYRAGFDTRSTTGTGTGTNTASAPPQEGPHA